MYHIPKGTLYFSLCLTKRFSTFSLDWFSGYQQEEDSFSEKNVTIALRDCLSSYFMTVTLFLCFGITVNPSSFT